MNLTDRTSAAGRVSRLQYRPDIDGLRAIAVLPVVFYHAGFSLFAGGYVGVDIFLVISGYLITFLIRIDLDQDRFSFARFYERRARRILPALFVMLATSLPAAWIWLLPDDLQSFSRSLIGVVTFTANIAFWREAGYFDVSAQLKPLLHTWSLSVEEQFYFVFPILLFLCRRFSQALRVSLILATLVFSLALAQWGSGHSAAANFFLLPMRIWELAAGSFLAINRTEPLGHTRANDLLSLLGLVMIGLAIFCFTDHTPYPSIFTLLPVGGTCLVIAFANGAPFVQRLLAVRPVVAVGLISYSLYLWHQPTLAFARHALSGPPSTLTTWLLIAALFPISYLSWRYVEQPFRRSAAISRYIIVLAACVGSAFFLSLGAITIMRAGFPQRAWTKRFADLRFSMQPEKFADCPTGLIPTDEALNICSYPKSGAPTAVIVGDSHAADKLPGIATADTHRSWALMARSSCPPLLNVTITQPGIACGDRQAHYIDRILAEPSIRTVLLSFFSGYTEADDFAADHRLRSNGPREIGLSDDGDRTAGKRAAFAAGLERTVAKLSAGGKMVVLAIDVPELPFRPADCLKGAACALSRQTIDERQRATREIFTALAAKYPNVTLYDPDPLFCDARRCASTRNGRVFYRDSNHLSSVGSMIYGRRLVDWLDAR